MAEMQEFIDGATAVAAVLAAVGAWSNARRIDGLAGRVDALERTVQTVLMMSSGARLGLVGSEEQVYEASLTRDEAKRVAYALLLAADGIEPRA